MTAFAERVRQTAGEDFNRLGLELLAFSLKDISDSQGYLQALGARRIAEVKRDAALAQAETERDSAIQASEYRKEGDIARLAAEAELAKATRDFEMQRAEFQSAVNAKRAKADIAYDLERAKLSEELKRQEYAVRLAEKELAAKVEEQEIVRREKELEATVKRPAEAMHYQAKLEAETDAYQKELEAKGKAAGIRLYGSAEAEAISARGKAEADAMRQKAAGVEGVHQRGTHRDGHQAAAGARQGDLRAPVEGGQDRDGRRRGRHLQAHRAGGEGSGAAPGRRGVADGFEARGGPQARQEGREREVRVVSPRKVR